MNDIVFLTGATGLVGRNLVARILQADDDSSLILLIRGKNDCEVIRRCDELLRSISSTVNINQVKRRVRAVRGDITLNRLGLSRTVYCELASKVTHIIHSAASVKFQLPLDKAREVNLNGTKNVIAFARYARQVGKLKKVAYIGTAYVSGNRSGIIKEDELDCGQQFSNTYEQTKFEAEKVIRASTNDLPITVFRPSLIVGDSKTGMTTAFNVLYAPLKFISKGFLKIIPGSRRASLDVVPVDFVCDAIFHIFFKVDGCLGRTYHITTGEKNALTAGEIVDLAVDYFNRLSDGNLIPRVKFVPIKLCKAVKHFLGYRKRRMLETMEDYVPYIEGKRFFDTANTDEALKETNITPPLYRQYYKILLHYCLLTKWGKHTIISENTWKPARTECLGA